MCGPLVGQLHPLLRHVQVMHGHMVNNNNDDGRRSAVGGIQRKTPRFGGKEFKIEIDSSIWREEIDSPSTPHHNHNHNLHVKQHDHDHDRYYYYHFISRRHCYHPHPQGMVSWYLTNSQAALLFPSRIETYAMAFPYPRRGQRSCRDEASHARGTCQTTQFVIDFDYEYCYHVQSQFHCHHCTLS